MDWPKERQSELVGFAQCSSLGVVGKTGFGLERQFRSVYLE